MTSAILKSCFVSSLLLLAACKDIPVWNGKIWIGDSTNLAITRIDETDARVYIFANDTRFDSYVAMSQEDFKSFYETYVLGCKEWKTEIELRPALAAKMELELQGIK